MTSERDLPSAASAMAKQTLVDKKAIDKVKPKSIFHTAHVRAVIVCTDCGRPRLIHSMKKPTARQLSGIDAFAEQYDYRCGDALFDEDDLGEQACRCFACLPAPSKLLHTSGLSSTPHPSLTE